MPHTLIVAQFHPVASSYWLPRSGQLAAARIPTVPFWALRFSLDDFEEDSDRPQQLCVVSPEPSPVPLPNASLTLGPKHAVLSGTFYTGDEDLTAKAALPCPDRMLRRPVYLHTTPVIWMHMFCSPPVECVVCQLEEDSIRRFRQAVQDGTKALYKYRNNKEQEKWAAQVAQWGRHDLSEFVFGQHGWDPTYMFSHLNNPKAYCFTFFYSGNVPGFGDRPTIYDELLLYAQICKDYRWEGVERSLLWVRDMRVENRSEHRILALPEILNTRCTPFEGDPTFREAVKQLPGGRRPITLEEEEEMEEADDDTSDSTLESDNSRYVWVSWLKWAFPELALEFPELPLGNPRVVVLDLFGVVLDREAAIRCAFDKWLSFAHHGQTVEGILSRYIEIEALVARKNINAASSLATIVHGALQTLADKLAIPPQVRSQLIADATAVILKPTPYRDAERAIAALTEQGRSILVIPPHSEVTMQHSLPSDLRSRVRTVNEPLSAYFAAPDSFFTALLAQCRAIRSDIQPADILLVSTNVARVTAPASLAGHPTALLKRTGTIASQVQFLVARVAYGNPVPSVVVGDLDELCERLYAHRDSEVA
ncbi:hypothetical protein C8Q70DRAFT_933206 [Cubamyces menziesii]|uniref:Uncharacterized protein n=1 Tax=Trametes cubensis TaxID=1111947 RepID=A0AAD7TS19_9APHY|nr:hypothetical protein C8Q70DRAFT_933206 [Cubamyces menziesii]KAJ8473565.1 hypothetical protein ONZ51_g7782 [Trametes cubensis]